MVEHLSGVPAFIPFKHAVNAAAVVGVHIVKKQALAQLYCTAWLTMTQGGRCLL